MQLERLEPSDELMDSADPMGNKLPFFHKIFNFSCVVIRIIQSQSNALQRCAVDDLLYKVRGPECFPNPWYLIIF